jgi:hypothetical protein
MPSLSPQKVAYLYFSILTNKNAGNIETEKNDYTNRCIQYLSKRLNDIPNELKEQVEKLTYDGWQYALCRQAAYLNDSDIKSFINMSGNLPDSKEMYDKLRSMLPDKQEAERNYKNYIDKATRTLKNLSRQYSIKFKDRSHTARSLNNIGYSGSNKIISIVQVYGNQQKIKQIYGQVPSQFMSDWAKVKQNELV